ncbi:MAG: hypothetical protein IPF99_36440 [Deltaproteobacteria bacterium]|nr:hypothetical protein [Deltaproteobacteria bacterium]
MVPAPVAASAGSTASSPGSSSCAACRSRSFAACSPSPCVVALLVVALLVVALLVALLRLVLDRRGGTAVAHSRLGLVGARLARLVAGHDEAVAPVARGGEHQPGVGSASAVVVLPTLAPGALDHGHHVHRLGGDPEAHPVSSAEVHHLLPAVTALGVGRVAPAQASVQGDAPRAVLGRDVSARRRPVLRARGHRESEGGENRREANGRRATCGGS